jgi:ABC-2 type transport system permease protein
MSPARIVRLVAGREIRERGRSREMVVSTIVSLVIIAVVVFAAGAGGDDGPSYDVGTVGERPAEVAGVMRSLAADSADSAGGDSDGDGDGSAVRLSVETVADRAEAERLVSDGDLDAVLVGDEVVVDKDLDRELGALIQAAHRSLAIEGALADAGASPDQVAAASAEPLATRALDPGDDTDDRTSLAVIGTILLYAQLFGFGYWVASGIVEEKASRVVEVLLAKAGPRPLLAGKIIGIGTVALAQLVVFVAGGLGLAAAVGTVDIPSGTGRLAVELVAWFLLGFAVYACVFAMSGAIASRVEELQTSTGPIALAAMGGFFAAIAAAENPDGPVAQVATFVPVAAPMVLPVRSAAGALPAWEAAVAVALVVATAVIVVRLAARVYAGGALFTRGPLKLREALARGRD